MKLIAYLDPGTGSFIAQAVIGGAAGVAILVKTKGKQMFGKRSRISPSRIQPSSTPPRSTPPPNPSSRPSRPQPDRTRDHPPRASHRARRRIPTPGRSATRATGCSPSTVRSTGRSTRETSTPGRPWRNSRFFGEQLVRGNVVDTEPARQHRHPARATTGGLGRGAPPSTHPDRVVPVRVDVLDAARRRPAPARAARGGPGRGHDPQGLDPVQRPVRRRPAGVHRHRVVRAARTR